MLKVEERYPKNYSESLIQWVWQEMEFDTSGLFTLCGKDLQIVQPGTLNHGAGPDFLNSKLIIDGIQWHGSVEIHYKEADWYSHGHQIDPVYNSVVLHVVLERSKSRVKREDRTEPYTLELDQYLSRPLSELVQFKNSRRGIACKGLGSFKSQSAFEKQIHKVSSEYFEYKAEELLYECKSDTKLNMKKWREVLITRVYDVLGIPANRVQMKELGRRMISLAGEMKMYEMKHTIEKALKLAFSETDNSIKIDWIKTGMRPASRPEKRVIQAAAMHHSIISLPVQMYLDDPQESWRRLLAQIDSQHKAGSGRMNLIKNTVYLPAIYLLGNRRGSKVLMRRAYEVWLEGVHIIPDEVLEPFKKAGFKIRGEAKSLGLAHQLKRYCHHQRCFDCELFKNAIRS